MANTRTTTSRKPRTAARAASRPSTRPAVLDEQESTEAEEVSAAEAQEIEAEGHYVTAELCGEDVQVVPPTAWRTSWHRMLNQGNLDGFAEKVFSPEDYDRYLELDPTLIEFMEFVADASEQAGESLGNSRGPATSSRRTRRR